jgi:hypothetical protein
MVQPEPDTGTSPTLEEAGARYAEAKRAWAETFLFYYNQPGGKRPRTVAEAQAMADIEVNLTQAMVDWEVARAYQSRS